MILNKKVVKRIDERFGSLGDDVNKKLSKKLEEDLVGSIELAASLTGATQQQIYLLLLDTYYTSGDSHLQKEIRSSYKTFGLTRQQAYLEVATMNFNEQNYEHAERFYREYGLNKKDAALIVADGYARNKKYESAAKSYEAAGMKEMAREFWIKHANELFTEASENTYNPNYKDALKIYKKCGEKEKEAACWKARAVQKISGANSNIAVAKRYYRKANVPKEDAALEVEALAKIKDGEHAEVFDAFLRKGLNKREAGLKVAELCDTISQIHYNFYGIAARYYEKVSKIKDAKDRWKRCGDGRRCNHSYEDAVESYVKSGLTKRQANLLIAKDCESQDKFDTAAKYYKLSRAPKKARECWLKTAEAFISHFQLGSAISTYKTAGVSLSDVPLKEREKLLDKVKEGNIEITQNLASLVENEEEELIFNEARAGMVL
jgi:hypothetical protein